MDAYLPLGLAAVVALVLINAFFVATEFAIVAVRRSRLWELAAAGSAAARTAQGVVGQLDAYIAACQLGITMASLALGWIGEPALAGLVEPPLRLVPHGLGPLAAHAVTAGFAFVIITALHIVIGELAPKGLALQRPDSIALWVARPIRLFYFVFRWPIALLNGIGNQVLRLAGVEPVAGHEQVHSAEELRYLVASSQRAGAVEATEAEVASRALEFADRNAGSLMTPRTEVDALSAALDGEALVRRVAASRHSRLPVYRGSLDDVVGVLHVRDLFAALVERDVKLDLDALLRPVLAVPETLPADGLMERMRSERRQLVVVIDEYGGTAGIVTMEDVMEALIGSIEQEPGLGEVSSPTPVGGDDAGSLLLSGLTRLDELEDVIGLHAERAAREHVQTLGGLVMARLGRLPSVGDEVHLASRRLRIEELDGNRVAVVRVLAGQADAHPG